MTSQQMWVWHVDGDQGVWYLPLGMDELMSIICLSC